MAATMAAMMVIIRWLRHGCDDGCDNGDYQMAAMMNPIKIYLGITDVLTDISVSYEYIMLEATVNLYNTEYLRKLWLYFLKLWLS